MHSIFCFEEEVPVYNVTAPPSPFTTITRPIDPAIITLKISLFSRSARWPYGVAAHSCTAAERVGCTRSGQRLAVPTASVGSGVSLPPSCLLHLPRYPS